MPPTSAKSEPSAATPAADGCHCLWRPGVGLAVWIDGATDAAHLPDPVGSLLAGKRFRRQVSVLGPDGRREFVTTVTLGTTSALTLLDATRSLPVSGELAWYRHIVDGVRRFVAAGAIAPSISEIAGESVVRWQILPTPAWRSWWAVVTGAAPQALINNGGAQALQDFAAEAVDHECRARIAASAAHRGAPAQPRVPVLSALIGDATAPDSATRPTAASAWAQWSTSLAAGETVLVFRLHEPDDHSAEQRYSGEADHPDQLRWRLQVCRRMLDGHIVAVEPHRLDTDELDQVTTDLAAAVRVFPGLSQADPDRTTLDFLLSTALAEELFATGAAALGDAGFPVLLPRAIAVVRPTLGIRAVPVVGGGAPARMVGLNEIREFEWRLALGDDPAAAALSEAELDELSRQKGDLVRVRGVWVRAEGAALARAAAYVVSQRALAASGHQPDMGELFGLIAGDSTALPAPITSVTGLDWLDEVAAGTSISPAAVSAPDGLTTPLRPYQLRGLQWLAHLSARGIGAVLADDMGLGKTIQVIALLAHERQAPPGSPLTASAQPAPTLIVCPMSVVGNWSRELDRFAPALRVTIHHGPERPRGDDFTSVHTGIDVMLTTFAIAARDREVLAGHQWGRLVVDEAQHVKNVRTAAARALRQIPAAHRVALTGTPVENRLEDLRAVIDLVNPGLLGSASTFRNRYAEPIERHRDPDVIRRLSALTSPFILRREKTDPTIISDLPEKTELTVRANLSVEQAALYRAVIDDLMHALRDKRQRTLRRRTVLAALTRLKQICNHPAHYLADGSPLTRRGAHRSGKLELLEDILTTVVAQGDQALVFTQFAAFGDMLSQWLTERVGTEIPLLHGGLNRADRDRLVHQFQHGTPRPPILIATLKAGGTGLNLTAANHVVHVDRWWNPAVEDQATDRAYRIGQHQRVHVRRFVCVGTLEERIDDLIVNKRELSRLTVSNGENWMGDLGDRELLELFALRDDAVSQ